MRSAEPQIARLPESLAHGQSAADVVPFRGFRDRAPFPRSGGGSGGPARRGPRIEFELDSGPSAAHEARAAVGALEGRTAVAVLDDVRLLLSELVTNAVRHSGSSKIELSVAVTAGAVRAEVTDQGRGFAPSPRSAPWTQAGGWGLHLVDNLATRWGVDRGARVRVWFEIDTAA
jgi:anti-sigma regulatory factor (Ser/Thr protein kinase)